MKGLLLKEYYSMRPYLKKQVAVLFVFFIVFSVFSGSLVTLMPMILFFIGNLLLSSFSLDEQAHWNSYALTLPVSPQNIIASKYILFLGSLFISFSFGTAIAALIEKFLLHNDVAALLSSAFTSFFLVCMITLILLPLCIKIGLERARIAIVLCYMSLFLMVTILVQYTDSFFSFLMPVLSLPLPLLIFLAVALFFFFIFVSYFLAVKFYQAKEF